jgi:hypothetical protein
VRLQFKEDLRIHPSDILVDDHDGVVVVPLSQVEHAGAICQDKEEVGSKTAMALMMGICGRDTSEVEPGGISYLKSSTKDKLTKDSARVINHHLPPRRRPKPHSQILQHSFVINGAKSLRYTNYFPYPVLSLACMWPITCPNELIRYLGSKSSDKLLKVREGA